MPDLSRLDAMASHFRFEYTCDSGVYGKIWKASIKAMRGRNIIALAVETGTDSEQQAVDNAVKAVEIAVARGRVWERG